jgi:hypothetical protein
MIDCGSLDNRRNLAAYIATIRNITNGNLTIATQCESEVCNALWGSGNPDVDGIGVCLECMLYTPANATVDDHWLLLYKRE